MVFTSYSIKSKKLCPTILALSVSSILSSQATYAEETTAELSEVNVVAKEDVKASIEKKNKEIIQQELIQNNRDLVRYSPDVGIVTKVDIKKDLLFVEWKTTV